MSFARTRAELLMELEHQSKHCPSELVIKVGMAFGFLIDRSSDLVVILRRDDGAKLCVPLPGPVKQVYVEHAIAVLQGIVKDEDAAIEPEEEAIE